MDKKRSWLFMFKTTVFIVLVYVLEETFQWMLTVYNQSELNFALIPFHNNYFSYSPCYLTEPGMGSEFFSSPAATLRFIIYGVLGFIMYGIASMVISILPIINKQANRINSVLFYVVIAFSFLLAFFFPPKKTMISPESKTITITRYNYFFIPVTGTLSFDAIEDISYEIISDYDGYNKQYVYYLSLFVKYSGQKKMRLGEIEVGKQKGTLQKKPVWHESKEVITTGDNVVRLIKQQIGFHVPQI